MIIVMQSDATTEEVDHIRERIREMGYVDHPIIGKERVVIGAIGDERGKSRLQFLESAPGVESVVPILKQYKLAGKEEKRPRSASEILRSATAGLSLWPAPARSRIASS